MTIENVNKLMGIIGFRYFNKYKDINNDTTINYKYEDYTIRITYVNGCPYNVCTVFKGLLYHRLRDKNVSELFKFLNEEYKDVIRQHKIKCIIE